MDASAHTPLFCQSTDVHQDSKTEWGMKLTTDFSSIKNFKSKFKVCLTIKTPDAQLHMLTNISVKFHD
jgi:hypothetical protein